MQEAIRGREAGGGADTLLGGRVSEGIWVFGGKISWMLLKRLLLKHVPWRDVDGEGCRQWSRPFVSDKGESLRWGNWQGGGGRRLTRNHHLRGFKKKERV